MHRNRGRFPSGQRPLFWSLFGRYGRYKIPIFTNSGKELYAKSVAIQPFFIMHQKPQKVIVIIHTQEVSGSSPFTPTKEERFTR